jgi:uncharacterized protein DUF3309
MKRAARPPNYLPNFQQSQVIRRILPNNRRLSGKRTHVSLIINSLCMAHFQQNKNYVVKLKIEGKYMPIGTILLIVLLVMLVGAVPAWPYSRSWGYYPSGGLGVVVIILLMLLLLGYI